MAAASRAAQRESERRYKQTLKAKIAAETADAVAELDEIIADLVSIHASCVDRIDWNGVAASDRPTPPTFCKENELHAQARLDSFQPRKLDFFAGGSSSRRQRLIEAVAAGREMDNRIFRQAEEKYRSELAEWKADTTLAKRLLAGEPAAIRDVIGKMLSFSKEGLLGTDIRFEIDEGVTHAILSIHGDEIVPRVRRKKLASGRLSETKMPVGDFNEIYQDYVCSSAIRIGNDLLNILPTDQAYVTCTPMKLDTASGHLRKTPILSVKFVRETLTRLNLSTVDPSDALSNFNHAMNFKRTKGFLEISPLRPINSQ